MAHNGSVTRFILSFAQVLKRTIPLPEPQFYFSRCYNFQTHKCLIYNADFRAMKLKLTKKIRLI